MTKELRDSLDKLRAIADIANALVVQMAELLKLREAVRKAEEARARKTAKQRHREIISTAYRAKADAFEMEAQAKHRLATRRDNDAFSSCSSGHRREFSRASLRSAHSKRHKENKSSAWQTIHAIPVAMKNMGKSLSPLQRDILAVLEEWPTFELAEVAAPGSVKIGRCRATSFAAWGGRRPARPRQQYPVRFSTCIKRDSWRVHLAS